jgi:hypothetical protein
VGWTAGANLAARWLFAELFKNLAVLEPDVYINR